MKFNVEMDKRELKKLLDKPNPTVKFLKKLNKEVIKNIKKNIKKIRKNWTWRMLYYAVLCLLIVGLFVLVGFKNYNKGFYTGFDVANNACEQKQIHKFTIEQEDKPLLETFSWFLRKVIIALGNNLPLLFLVIAIAWICNGVGFKII
jgi:cytoskeletal protein RodZ